MKTQVKPVLLKNVRTNEIFICDDYKNIKLIDGVEFVQVHKDPNPRQFWMSKSVFEKVKTK